MSFFVLQIPPSDDVAEDDPARKVTDNLDEFMGAFVVDNLIESQRVILTEDLLGRARRFDTAQLAYSFSLLGGLKQVPTNVLRIDGHGTAQRHD